MKKIIFISVILTLLISACRKDYVAVRTMPPITDTLRFKTDIYPIFKSYSCDKIGGCHASGDYNPDLSTDSIAYVRLQSGGFINIASPLSSGLYISLTPACAFGQMPQDGPPFLTTDEMKKVEIWMQQGAFY